MSFTIVAVAGLAMGAAKMIKGGIDKSKAKKYLESGKIEDFMHEAFHPEVGFVKINGEVSRGLVRRRGEEARLFGESDIAEGGSLGTMMSDILSAINPIKEAAAGTLPPGVAGTLPPTEEAAPQNQSIKDTIAEYFDTGSEEEEASKRKEVFDILLGFDPTDPSIQDMSVGALLAGIVGNKAKAVGKVLKSTDEIIKVINDVGRNILETKITKTGVSAVKTVNRMGNPKKVRKNFKKGTTEGELKDWLRGTTLTGAVVAGTTAAVSTQAEAAPQTLLKRNSKDTESVGKLQDMLGMNVGKDRGIFGPATEAAVKVFQKEQGLPADGIVGKDTFAALQGSESEGESIFSRLNLFSSAEAGEAQAALPPPSKVNGSPLTEDDQGYWDILTSTPALAGVADVLIRTLPEFMQQPVWNENVLSPNTFKFLKKHASESISKGKLFLDYSTDKEGVKSVSHKAGIPDLRKPSNELKFFVGKGTYVKYNNIAYLADEYDYNYNLELRDQNIFSKLFQVYDRAQEYKEGKVGKFAVIDSVLERFQAKPGEGVSVRIKLGTPKELGLSQEDFDRLPTFENYESKQTIKKENIGWRPDNGNS